MGFIEVKDLCFLPLETQQQQHYSKVRRYFHTSLHPRWIPATSASVPMVFPRNPRGQHHPISVQFSNWAMPKADSDTCCYRCWKLNFIAWSFRKCCASNRLTSFNLALVCKTDTVWAIDKYLHFTSGNESPVSRVCVTGPAAIAS